jgi:hypothetical protein
MLTSLKVGPRLALGFALVLVLLGMGSALALSRLAALKADLAAVTGEAPERLASKLRDLARYQSVTIRDVIMQDDMAFKKKEFDLMKAARADYDKTAQALAGMVNDEPTRTALTQAAAALDSTKGLIEKIVDLTMNDDMAGASAMIRDQLRPAQQAHVKALDAVIDAIKASSNQRDEAATAAYKMSVASSACRLPRWWSVRWWPGASSSASRARWPRRCRSRSPSPKATCRGRSASSPTTRWAGSCRHWPR